MAVDVKAGWLAVAVVTVALAGCSDPEAAADDPSEPELAAEAVLRAVIAVRLNGTLLQPADGPAGNASGNSSLAAPALDVPLGKALTFDGAASGPKVLTFAWDFGDNATASDQSEEHTYSEPGNYTVRLTVTGGETGNGTANATLALRVAGTPKGAFLATQEFPIEGSLPLMNPNSCTNQGVDCQDFPIALVDAIDGRPAVASAVRINVTGSGDLAVDLQVFWRSPDGTTLAQTDASGLEHALTYEGEMAAGEYLARVRLFIGAGASFTGTVHVDYITA